MVIDLNLILDIIVIIVFIYYIYLLIKLNKQFKELEKSRKEILELCELAVKECVYTRNKAKELTVINNTLVTNHDTMAKAIEVMNEKIEKIKGQII